MKRKYLIPIGGSLLAASLIMSCSKDSDKNNIPVQGIWEQQDLGPGYKQVYNFKDNDIVEHTTIFTTDAGKQVEKENLKYLVSGDSITITVGGMDNDYIATLKGDTLTLNQNGHVTTYFAITPQTLNDYLTKQLEKAPEPDFTEPPEDPNETDNYD